MTGITWIASYPKSGNTWVRLFLTNLFHNGPEPAPIDKVAHYSLGDNSRAHYEKVAGGPIGDPTPARLVQLRFAFQQALARNRADYLLCKTHWPCTNIYGESFFDPRSTAAAIYVVRDPRDVAVSFAYHMNISFDTAIRWLGSEKSVTKGKGGKIREFFGDWSSHVASWMTCRTFPVCIIRYEDLLADPEAQFDRIVQFLNFPSDAERLSRAVRFSSFALAQAQEERTGFKESNSHANRFFRQGRAGVAADELSPAQVARIECDHGTLMRKLGYEPEHAGPVR
ncbi:MAG: sulfotransferase domain-containing protein [Rhodovibrio sp.]|nr:sulfotransferase domain-containing protein [Rhodovibrio sp.]